MDAPEFHDLFFGGDTYPVSEPEFSQASDPVQDSGSWVADFDFQDFLGDVPTLNQTSYPPPAQNQNGYGHPNGFGKTQYPHNGLGNYSVPPAQELPKFDTFTKSFLPTAPKISGPEVPIPDIICGSNQFPNHLDQSGYSRPPDLFQTQQKPSPVQPYGSRPLGSPYQKVITLPPSPYAKPIESPYGSVKSDSPYKPLGSPYSLGKPVESPYNLGKPVESPYSQGKQVESPYSVSKPLDSPYGSKPTESPYSASKPVGSPYGVARSLGSPFSIVKPLESSYGYENGHRGENSYQPIKPVESPFSKPVESPFSKPVESPFSKPVESPYSLPRSVESHHMFGRSVESPYGMPRSVETPQYTPRPLESPYSMPRSVDNSLLSGKSAESPYAMPRSVENPQLMGKGSDMPSNLPKSCDNLQTLSRGPDPFSSLRPIDIPLIDHKTDLLAVQPIPMHKLPDAGYLIPTMVEDLKPTARPTAFSEPVDESVQAENAKDQALPALLPVVIPPKQDEVEANQTLDEIARLINKQVENFAAGALNDSFCSDTSATNTPEKVLVVPVTSESPAITHRAIQELIAPEVKEPEKAESMEVECPIDKKLEMLFREEKDEVKPEVKVERTVMDSIDEVERKLEALHGNTSEPKAKAPINLGISEVFQTPPSTSSSPCDLQSVPCDKSKQVEVRPKPVEPSTSALLSPSSNEGDLNQRVKNCSCILCEEHFSRRKHRKKRKKEENSDVIFKSEVCTDKVGIKLKISRSGLALEPSPPQLEPEVPILTPRPRPDYSLMKPDFLKDPNFFKGDSDYVRKSKKSAKKKKSKKRKHQSSDSDFEGFQDWRPEDIRLLSRPVPTPDEEATPRSDIGDQSPWAHSMPPELLERIFGEVVDADGCLPALVRLSKVCRLWHSAASSPKLWHTIDLSCHCIKEKHRTERKLVWLLQNRLSGVKDISLGGWNSALRPGVIQLIASGCVQLEGLSFHGCSAITQDHIIYLVQVLKNLRRLDLSNVSDITQSGKNSPVSQSAITEVSKLMGERLTHLNLAGNSTSGLANAINAVAASCPNLEALDLSNVRTYNRDHALINVEKLQAGCKKIRVLRMTNIQLRLAPSSSKEQALSQGFPDLEELSVAVSTKNDFGIDDSALERIVKTSTKLRLLDVRGCVAISYSSLVRVPAWDLEQLFLSGCKATRYGGDGLELVARKWRHSLEILDLSWSTAPEALDLALATLAEQENSPLKSLDLNGSTVGYTAVKSLLDKCISLTSLNLSSCRSLPRGMKRNYANPVEVAELRSAIEAGRFDEKPDSDQDE